MLALATSGGAATHPYFFEGELTKPRLTALALRALSIVVGSRFYVPPAMIGRLIALSDPVVTSSRGMLRFEGFSSCASAYVRLDLTETSFDGQVNGFGTTNVDFNAGMRAALASVRDGATLALSVGKHELALHTLGRRVVERKVPLPVRWLKGFVEVQAYLARMTLFHEIARTDAMRFLRGLPRAKTHKHDVYIVPQGATVRASMTAAAGALRTTALERLRVLEELASHAQALRIYGEPNGQASAWELDFGALRSRSLSRRKYGAASPAKDNRSSRSPRRTRSQGCCRRCAPSCVGRLCSILPHWQSRSRPASPRSISRFEFSAHADWLDSTSARRLSFIESSPSTWTRSRISLRAWKARANW